MRGLKDRIIRVPREFLTNTENSEYGGASSDELVPNFDEMLRIFHFLGEYIGKILMARDVFDCKKVPFDVLTDDIFPHLHVSESFCRCPFTPVNAGSVVIVYRCCCTWWEE